MMLTTTNTGPLLSANHITSTRPTGETLAHKKLRKAAQEFEGILISQLLGEFHLGFSSLSGDSGPTGSNSLNSLAIQSLSVALASRGGLGIGQMLVHQLEPSLNREEHDSGGEKIKTASQG